MADPAALKAAGNAHFAANRYKEAVEAYTQAIEASAGAEAALFSNRSVAFLNLNELSQALEDAEACIKLKKDWEKGHWRHGAALEALGRPAEALKAYQRGAKLTDSAEFKDKVRGLKNRLKAAEKEKYLQQQAEAARFARSMGSAPRVVRDDFAQNAAGQYSTSVTFGPSGPQVSQVQAPGAGGKAAPDAWVKGLRGDTKYEWFVDSYRMRVDDDFTWGGGKQRGCKDPSATVVSILEDFLVYCKMAVSQGVIPGSWDWAKLIAAAAPLLALPFSKADAIKKYGGENYFDSMNGGRSLRYTAEVVLATNLYGEGQLVPQKRLEKIQKQVLTKWSKLRADESKHGEVFGDLGGVEAWVRLAGTMAPPAGRYY